MNRVSTYKLIAKISTSGKFIVFVNYKNFKDSVLMVMDSVPDTKKEQVQKQANQKYPRWFGPNIIKFFVVLDDLSAATDETKVRAESAMHYFTSTYGEVIF